MNLTSNTDLNMILKVHEESLQHMLRCRDYAIEFGEYLGFNKVDLDLLGKCALLHDIGKLVLEPTILYKPAKLTQEEYKYVQTHCDYEVTHLREEIQLVIKYHHTHPEVYKSKIEEKNSKFIKIITLIDAFDAMSHKRIYKNYECSLEEVIEEIEKNLGSQFDNYYGNQFINFVEEIININMSVI